ncbi:MAG: flavin reductase family protein [Proteobacteria bacterium]|nr:flavin reductase family protein [Pseudomonadota bacterium]
MAKRSLQPKISLSPFPTPTVMVTCRDHAGEVNIITLGWVGVVNSEPPMIGIAVRPSRFSHRMIKESREFAVNVPSEKLLKVTDFCGVVSGKDVDKFESTGLSAVPAEKIRAPLIQECLVNLECVVRKILSLGSHDLFIAEVVVFHVEKTVLKNGQSIRIENVLPFTYCHGARQYWNLGRSIGAYGFTRGRL